MKVRSQCLWKTNRIQLEKYSSLASINLRIRSLKWSVVESVNKSRWSTVACCEDCWQKCSRSKMSFKQLKTDRKMQFIWINTDAPTYLWSINHVLTPRSMCCECETVSSDCAPLKRRTWSFCSFINQQKNKVARCFKYLLEKNLNLCLTLHRMLLKIWSQMWV